MSYATNKNATRQYEILKKYTAGIKLLGFEVKAVRTGKAQITGAHISIKDNQEAFLLNAHISPYQPLNTPAGYDPARARKLLLQKKEIRDIQHQLASKGLTVIPLTVYNKNNNIKVEIALVKGKRKYDHRQKIRAKDTRREIGRHI